MIPERVEAPMTSTKDTSDTKDKVRKLLDRLPDDVSMDRVLYHLYVLSKVEEGLAAVEAGDVKPHEEMVREMREWFEARREASSGRDRPEKT